MESLNLRAMAVCEEALRAARDLGIEVAATDERHSILDFGVSARGSNDAGLWLTRICCADLVRPDFRSLTYHGRTYPSVRVETSEPLRGCMGSQYAGWQIAAGKYFAMCSGPIRAAAAREKLFDAYSLREAPAVAVGVLESAQVPDPEALQWIRQRMPPSVQRLVLCVAPTHSIAGRIQIVARSIETACHKLSELGVDLRTIRRGEGIAPIPPATADDFQAMGNTNDAILFASRVELVVDWDRSAVDAIGPQIPSCSSRQFGRPFAELFSECGRDFYRLDPLLFAPAEITLTSARSDYRRTFGDVRLDLYTQALGSQDSSAPHNEV